MATDPFGTAINCIDGRAQRPVADWVATNGQVKYVDMVTEPGADGVLASGAPAERIAEIRQAVEVSAGAHNSTIVAIAGHDGCAANPVSEEEHRENIRQAAKVVAGWGLPVCVVGLWVDSWRQAQVVCDLANEPL
jgi:hypothetical protein